MAIGSNDSLNNFINKAGGQLSFGNRFRRARQPKGANFHTGYYYGPSDSEPGASDGEGESKTNGGTLVQRDFDERSDFKRSNYLAQRDLDAQVSSRSGEGLQSLLKPTPQENEDPINFGFEIVIDDLNSPLLNGEISNFMETFGVSNSEIRARENIYNGTLNESSRLDKSFKFQMQRFFKFKGEISSPASLSPNRRRHYIKKIEGLEKLIEKNGPQKPNSFVKYKEDTIKVSFYEDIGLSTEYFMNLYKILYWSRLRGKGVVPENLLRFDCQIIVSEVRNVARVVEALDKIEDSIIDEGTNTTNQRKIDRLEKKNKRPGGLRPRQQNKLDNLKKEIEDTTVKNNLQTIEDNVSRYVYNVYECQFHFDKTTHPSEIDLEEGVSAASRNTTIDISFKFSDMTYEKFEFTGGGWVVDKLKNSRLDPRGIQSNEADTNLDISSGSIKAFKTLPRKIDMGIKSNFKRTPPPDSALTALGKNLKKALLSEGQRQLNNQFRLLNNAIDKVRDSFGIGRMSDPTNVYKIPNNGSRLFFDVKNSLRNFVGDSLNNSLFGRGGE